ncbi:VanW family protein [Rhodococcus sp. WMMA185]|uniref:VanW family protein n=1 Tax=Rhodococcus sp. WMMA185 TaxID=679318 RepID=UPI0008791240|nr:VanW family protein [Rhodococcus sp. WMMA185]
MRDEDGDTGSDAHEVAPPEPNSDEAPTTQLNLGELNKRLDGEDSEPQDPDSQHPEPQDPDPQHPEPQDPEPQEWAEPAPYDAETQVIPAIAQQADTGQERAYSRAGELPDVPTADSPTGPTVGIEAQVPQTASASEPAATTRPPWAKIAAIAGAVIAVIAIAYVADLAMSSGKIPRGVTVAGVDVGGSTREAAAATLEAQVGPRVDQPVTVQAGDVSAELVPAAAGLGVDWEATLDRADSQPLNPFTRLASFFFTDEIGVVSTRDDAAMTAAIDDLRGQTDREPREGDVVFEDAAPVPVDPLTGQTLDGEGASAALTERWAFGQTVELPVDVVPVTVTREGVQRALDEIATPAVSADLVFAGRDGEAATLQREQVGAVLGFEPDGNGGLKPTYNLEAATDILAPQLESTEVEPKDATIALSGGSPTVVPAVVGDLVQWPQTLQELPELLRSNVSRTADAIYGEVEPALTTEDAQALGVKEVISEFTTSGFSAASGTNIRLAAAQINGALIKPGDTFSMNDYTGPRGTAQGYVESGIINYGRPDTAVGGGVSQVATTLYNAAYFAGMEDVEHTEHSYYISRYPEAREATVFEGAIDLKFRNTSDTGVLIEAIGGSSDLTVRMWGTKTVDVQSITGNRTRPTQPETITLPAGDHCIPSGGAPGFTTSDTRVISDHATGREISRNTRTVRYDPVPVVKCEEPDDATESAERSPAAMPKPAVETPAATRTQSPVAASPTTTTTSPTTTTTKSRPKPMQEDE